jgi:hypothetical protein
MSGPPSRIMPSRPCKTCVAGANRSASNEPLLSRCFAALDVPIFVAARAASNLLPTCMIDDNPAEKISLRPKSAMERGRRQKIQPSRRYREYTASRAARCCQGRRRSPVSFCVVNKLLHGVPALTQFILTLATDLYSPRWMISTPVLWAPTSQSTRSTMASLGEFP